MIVKSKTVVIATRNKNKMKEMLAILSGSCPVRNKSRHRRGCRHALRAGRISNGVKLNFKMLTDFEGIPEIREDGKTLKANALKKAGMVSRVTGCWALADDTGLEVEYLNGRPGVFSARYAGPGCSYEDNCRKLLKQLANADIGSRKAVFKCVIALVSPAGRAVAVQGILQGKITLKPAGQNGFGYDPVFMPDGFKKTLAQMSLKQKNSISHRADALRKIAPYLLSSVKTLKENET
ncbi:MAG: RdgB/HAM1 family non-canonical purine NTP pyrophosphatase [Elusimicrobia bacterium]|nr:RdgB/HAM1 family non-canonical purine NTP pyrophosphatase [Elusimicrobiota bacterium]